jgi:hypothetical protein
VTVHKESLADKKEEKVEMGATRQLLVWMEQWAVMVAREATDSLAA